MTFKMIGHNLHTVNKFSKECEPVGNIGLVNTDKYPSIIPKLVVFHSIIAEGIDSALKQLRRNRRGTHFIIDEAGKIVQLLPVHKNARHTGKSHYYGERSVDTYSIGIHLIAEHKASDDFALEPVSKWFGTSNKILLNYTEEQASVAFDLCSALCDIYPIEDYVASHHVTYGRLKGPGPSFPLKEIKHAFVGINADVVTDIIPTPTSEHYAHEHDAVTLVSCALLNATSDEADVIHFLVEGTCLTILEPEYDKDGDKYYLVKSEDDEHGYIRSTFVRQLN